MRSRSSSCDARRQQIAAPTDDDHDRGRNETRRRRARAARRRFGQPAPRRRSRRGPRASPAAARAAARSGRRTRAPARRARARRGRPTPSGSIRPRSAARRADAAIQTRPAIVSSAATSTGHPTAAPIPREPGGEPLGGQRRRREGRLAEQAFHERGLPQRVRRRHDERRGEHRARDDTTTTARRPGAAAARSADHSHGVTAASRTASAPRTGRDRQHVKQLRATTRVDAAVLGEMRRDPRRIEEQAAGEQRRDVGGGAAIAASRPATSTRPGAIGRQTAHDADDREDEEPGILARKRQPRRAPMRGRASGGAARRPGGTSARAPASGRTAAPCPAS